MNKVERIVVTINTFHGECDVPLAGEWSAWNETLLAIKMSRAAEREMIKAATIHGKDSDCMCGGVRLPVPASSDNPDRIYLVPISWAGPIGQVYTLPPGVAAAVAKCDAWLDAWLEKAI